MTTVPTSIGKDTMSTPLLAHAIREGTFPDSEALLSSNLSAVDGLLNTISQARSDLNEDIRGTSKSLTGVDEWIAHAAKVQRDIQQCKVEARKIVEDHARVQSQQAEANEASQKAALLEKEIAFTQTLQSELRGVAATAQSLRSIEDLLSQGKASEAASRLSKLETSSINGPQVRTIIGEYQNDIDRRTRELLEANLDTLVTVEHDGQLSSIVVRPSDESSKADILALKNLSAIETLSTTIAAKLEAFANAVLRKGDGRCVGMYQDQDGRFLVHNDSIPSVSKAVRFSSGYIVYLHDRLPQELVRPVTGTVIPGIVSKLILEWLNPAIPTDLSGLDDYDAMRAEVSSFAQAIDSFGWPGAAQLAQWLEQAPRTWITKRKGETLDAVRRIFVISKGTTHQVERVERQKASTLEGAEKQATQDTHSSAEDAEDTSGWGFDEDEEEAGTPKKQKRKHDEDEDAGDAWGWDEDDSKETNGDRPTAQHSQELVLTEQYAVTDIPDHLIEVISKDIQDAFSLQEHEHPGLSDIPAASGLLALPTLALAMFRATASTHYSSNPNLGNMNLYNDASYLADKLRGMNAAADSSADCASMLKFARGAYAREMDTQRTILNDLLDGAQGFSNCTQFPYSQEIENAVTATIDRLRTVYTSWQPILSTSALLQATGALLSTTISKLVVDILELEDISEAQSHRLASFTTQFTTLEDLFLATPPDGSEAVPMTAVYVNNWLKLQYLAQILDSSLVDIRYLWTEGELGLEFEAEEVVDLVKALFAESGHRRAAIQAIRGGR